ncbi:hypothetical protein C9F11_40890 [Streptomyces sp. YIM 121038]|uniref:hypothetical protein n=1 Tax=Streptomyces sp. YIM 121038 TaxID=2136401 RepID=UPI001110EAFE|nr:hypothetical protein [Streptomyces sp. YIM 121038]QCX81758.1 hypothetical protein C9F11_40890 [Streptomyces sp. YIM 121038]
MDVFPSRVLLTLRRFIGTPLPGTDYCVQAAHRSGNDHCRVRLASPTSGSFLADLPERWPDGQQIGDWWYVGALRHAAQSARDQGLPPVRDDEDLPVVDLADVESAGLLARDIEVTAQDALDYVIADLVGDPLWHDAAASAAPDLYRLVGFDLRTPAVLRVYLWCDYGTIGVDLAVYDDDARRPRSVGWWASTKLIAILNPDDRETLPAHRADGVTDPLCDAVYDLTEWA